MNCTHEYAYKERLDGLCLQCWKERAIKAESRTNELNLETSRQQDEIRRFRQAMSQVARNLGNGSDACPGASIEFLTKQVPEEVRLVCQRREQELARARQVIEGYELDYNRVVVRNEKPAVEIAVDALTKIASADQDSLWMDDRDDAADSMLQEAKDALERLK